MLFTDTQYLLKVSSKYIKKNLMQATCIRYSNNIYFVKDSYNAPRPADDVLEFFPNHPAKRGIGNYEADKDSERLNTGCRKESVRHATLTPGNQCDRRYYCSGWHCHDHADQQSK